MPGIDTPEFHYNIYDKTGAGILIEFTNKGRTVYDFHIINLRNYVELNNTAHKPLHLGGDVFTPLGHGSGLLVTPGDLTPPSRLVRTATLTHFADPVKTSDEA